MNASASCHQEPGTEAASSLAVDLDVALVGRPNAGKSSLYNALTGGQAKVGNFPGITVDLLEADVPLPAGGRARIVDLPGVYSLAASVDEASDEGQARATLDRLLAGGKPLLFAQVIDATQTGSLVTLLTSSPGMSKVNNGTSCPSRSLKAIDGVSSIGK